MLKERLEIFWEIADRPWVRWASAVVGFISLYDLLGAQFLSSDEASKMPRVHDILSATAGWLPWWGWGWLLTGLVAIAVLEYSVGQNARIKAERNTQYAGRQFSSFSNVVLDAWSMFPSFGKWDAESVFSLGDVACLWLNHEPEKVLTREAAKAVYWRLHDDIYAGRLKAKLTIDESLSLASTQLGDYPKTGEDPITVDTKVGREELRRYALITKDRPMFLFKDARAGKKPEDV